MEIFQDGQFMCETIEIKIERVSPIPGSEPIDLAPVRKRRKMKTTDSEEGETQSAIEDDVQCIVLDAPFLIRHSIPKVDLSKIERTGEVKFKCKFCTDIFDSLNTLQIHTAFHNSNVEFRCKLCSFRCIEDNNLALHIKNFHDECVSTTEESDVIERKYTCEYCLTVFSSKKALSYHRMVDHRSYMCHDCKISFTTKQALLTHGVKKHQRQETLFVCSVCKMDFNSNSKFTRHMSSHLNEFPFGCNKCSFVCALNSELKMHMIHHDTKIIN